MTDQQIIDRLRNDEDYYGAFGSQFRSNSDIITILGNPSAFGSAIEKSVELLQGTYMHMKLLEPSKVYEFKERMIVKASTRNTNLYKDARDSSGESVILLESEVEVIDILCAKMKSNMSFYDEIYAEGNLYEEPAIVELFGHKWKCKADIVGKDGIPDIKSTSNIRKFRSSALTYNYDSAAYIYGEAFGKRMSFLVGCKKTLEIGRFTCSDDFIERGRQKVIKATAVYNRFFAQGAPENISDFFFEEEL